VRQEQEFQEDNQSGLKRQHGQHFSSSQSLMGAQGWIFEEYKTKLFALGALQGGYIRHI
jgi:hypothetical protein